jgi:hypothetical protein
MLSETGEGLPGKPWIVALKHGYWIPKCFSYHLRDRHCHSRLAVLEGRRMDIGRERPRGWMSPSATRRSAWGCPGIRAGIHTATVTTLGETTQAILELREFLEHEYVTTVMMKVTSVTGNYSLPARGDTAGDAYQCQGRAENSGLKNGHVATALSFRNEARRPVLTGTRQQSPQQSPCTRAGSRASGGRGSPGRRRPLRCHAARR